jgi:hypothetical protein
MEISGQSHAPAYYLRESGPGNNVIGAGWALVGSAGFGEEISLLLLPGFEPQIVKPVA